MSSTDLMIATDDIDDENVCILLLQYDPVTHIGRCIYFIDTLW